MIWSEVGTGEYIGENGIPGVRKSDLILILPFKNMCCFLLKISCGTHDMETFNRFKNTKASATSIVF
jgi:hypothetical protein